MDSKSTRYVFSSTLVSRLQLPEGISCQPSPVQLTAQLSLPLDAHGTDVITGLQPGIPGSKE